MATYWLPTFLNVWQSLQCVITQAAILMICCMQSGTSIGFTTQAVIFVDEVCSKSTVDLLFFCW